MTLTQNATQRNTPVATHHYRGSEENVSKHELIDRTIVQAGRTGQGLPGAHVGGLVVVQAKPHSIQFYIRSRKAEAGKGS